MTLDAETTRLALTILSVVVLPLASMAYTWIATRDKDNTAYIKAVEKTLGDEIVRHRSRLEQLEVNLSHLPRADDISGMKETIICRPNCACSPPATWSQASRCRIVNSLCTVSTRKMTTPTATAWAHKAIGLSFLSEKASLPGTS